MAEEAPVPVPQMSQLLNQGELQKVTQSQARWWYPRQVVETLVGSQGRSQVDGIPRWDQMWDWISTEHQGILLNMVESHGSPQISREECACLT